MSTSFHKNKLLQKLDLFLKKAKKPLIVILGPTASGKTALSIKLAHFFNGEIISTDSRQIYSQMPISTDIVLPAQRENIPHHLMNIKSPDKIITLAEYRELAIEKIKDIHSRKKLPFLVGGTGLYISAIIENYKVPKVPPNLKLRGKLEKEAIKKGPEFLYKKLHKLDPKAAEKIHPNNIRYVIRALEINLKTGKNKVDKKSNKSTFNIFIVGVSWPREELYRRIDERVENQIKRGLVEEVKNLLREGYDVGLPSMSSLGVKEILPFIRGKSSLTDCIATLKLNTRHYAKRQMTWFKRYAKVNWLKPEQLNEFLKFKLEL